MSSQPKVSVVMPAYNASLTIIASIECVLEQTYQNWELLIINDGSTDLTLTILGQFDDQRIRVFTQTNQGPSVARNIGLRQAKGEYIAFLDSDDLWVPTKLEKQISLFDGASNRLGLVYTKYRGFIEDPLRSFSMDVDASIGYKNPYDRLLIMCHIPLLSVMIRRSIIDDIGYFSEDICGTEDWDYWIRILKLYDFERLNEELALYRISPSSLSRNKERHAIEELKVLNRHLVNDSNTSVKVYHMARAFWYLKKIRHQLQSGRFKDVVISFQELIRLKPVYYVNYLFILYWSTSYIIQRIFFRLVRNLFIR
jgi:glycosyltransferase involved in cell wall biosynthesis